VSGGKGIEGCVANLIVVDIGNKEREILRVKVVFLAIDHGAYMDGW
jgi:hypothetical protein